jgi:hypothetical protein
VDPGQTVLLEGPPSGTTNAPYYGSVTLSHSGTSAAPITVTAQPGADIQGTLTLSGAHYVHVTGIDLYNRDAGDGITVSGSSNVVLDRDTVEMQKALKDEGSGPLGQTSISIDGGSSTVTVSRSEIDSSYGYGIQVGAGASAVTLTTNALYGADAGGVEAEGVPDLKVTSNTVYQSCGAAIALLDGTSASVENNVGGWFPCTADPGYTHPPTAPSLLVDAASAAGVTSDYDSRTHGRDSVPAHGWISDAVSSLHVPLYTQDAVLLNVTVTDPEAAGYVTVYQDHTAMPGTSNVNFAAGETVANQVSVTDGQLYVDFYNGSSKPIDLVVDTVGTFSNHARGLLYHPVGPVRVLDTRTGKQVAGRGTTSVKLAGTHGVPSNASAVVLNVTAADARSAGFLTAFGTGQALPGVSNSNWSTGQVVPALVTVPLTNGAVSLHNGGAGAVDFIADLVGYYDSSSTGAVFIHNAPVRLLDTRSGTGAPKQQLGAGQTLRLRIGTAVAAALNLTVTGSKGSGYLTAFPDGTSLPTSSSLNYNAGQTVANMTITPVGSDGYVDIHNGGRTPVSVMADLSGTYYSYG